MASQRAWTWPTRNQLHKKTIQRSNFVPVRSAEPENAQDLLKEDDAQGALEVKKIKHEESSTRIRKLFRSLGLETVYLLFKEIGGQSVIEEKKVATLGDLRSACYISLLHIIPTAASVTLLVFNWNGYYIGGELSGPVGEDGLKFLGLQFAAKMLELLAMASLSTIMFALVRGQLISHFLPFGAVTVGFEFNRLSLLWSKEFVATCGTNFSTSRQKSFLVAIIIIFTILGATIGPSAAVASQPVLRDWPAGGTNFWLNATSQDLWPSYLDNVALTDIPCTSSQNTSCFPQDYNLLASEMLSFWPSASSVSADDGSIASGMPEKALLSSRQSIQTLEARFIGPFIYHPSITVATTPSAAIADAVSEVARYWDIANTHQFTVGKPSFVYYNDFSITVSAMQPVTYVRCSESNVNSIVQFPRLDQGNGNYPLVNYGNTTVGSQQWLDMSTSNGSNPNVSWVELSEADFGLSSIGAVVALPGANATENHGQILACTVDARWAPATATVSFLGGPMTVSGLPTTWLSGAQLRLGSNGLPLWPQAKMATEWAESINPIISETSISVFAMLCNSVGRLDNILMAQSPINAVEAIIAVMITDSLARTSSMATILGSLKGLNTGEWMNEILPKDSVFGYGGSAFNYSYQPEDQSTEFYAKTTVNGYGYGIATATILSTLILLIYSLISMIYVVYSICFAKTTSSSWESITELVALAVNSKPSSALHNTGAGIATLRTLKQPVSIRVSDDRLQMVFGDEGESADKVTRNEFYG